MKPKNRMHCRKAPDRVGANHQGFTLIELLMAMLIMSLVLAPIISLFLSLGQSHAAQKAAVSAQQQTRRVIEIMIKEIRMAGLNPLASAAAGVEVASPANIRMTADQNLSGAIDDADYERITFTHNPGNQTLDLILYEGTASIEKQTLLRNVIDLAFVYRDAANAVTATPAAIRTVEISLTLEAPAGRSGTIARTYLARVRCRNIGL